MKTFEKVLPENYVLIKTVDCKNKKTAAALNAAAFAITVLTLVIGFLILKPSFSAIIAELDERYIIVLLELFGFIIANVLYIILHELTHGLAYKLLTKQKLKFGFSFTFAYCGVPDIYVYRTAALIALLAPFTVFSVAFGLLTAFLPGVLLKSGAIILLAVHLGGCVGDLYDTFLYLFKLRDPQILMRDFGATQEFYALASIEK